MKTNVCMIAYTNYGTDARVRRAAETFASLPDYNVIVLTLNETNSPRSYTSESVKVKELNISKYQGKSNLKYMLSYLKFLVLSFFACNKLLIKKSLDIVHVHNMPNFLVFAAFGPFLFGKKVILDIHDTMLETYASKFDVEGAKITKIILYALRFEEFISCAFAHKIICVNHIQEAEIIKRGIPENKIVVLLNVPDPRIFGNKKKIINYTNTNNRFKVVYHGTVTKRLSVDLAIRACTRLHNRIPGLEFLILGDGDDKQELINLSKELGINKYIHFRKRVQFEDMIPILEDMDLEVVPNRKNIATELMLPVKLLDCVALGIPVVVPRLKAIEYYFSNDMVFYFEPGSVDSLADAIYEAYINLAQRIEKAQNAEDFLVKYKWETHKYELINLYRSLL